MPHKSLLFCLLVAANAGLSVAAYAASDRPNIVWLVSEDNSVHYLKLFDESGAATPNIEKLAQHGLIFDHAFSNAPVCSVARTTLATGCYAPRIGTQYHRKHVAVPLPDGVRMFPELLRRAGYYTANNRKTDFNAVPGDDVWDVNSGKASWRGRKNGQPFFYMQSFAVCHESSLHFSTKQMQTQQTQTDPSTVFVAPYHPDTPTFRYTNARYRDRIVQVDEQIGAVVDRLEQDGLLEDTFIFYFGDHGGVLPRGKGYAYESGLHVPLVIRIPKNFRHLVAAQVGSRQQAFVSFIDFGPTALNLAGADIPEQMDGVPFLGPGVTAAELKSRDSAYGYADRFDEKYDLVRTLRKGRFEYIRNFQPFNFDGLQNNYRYRMLAFQEWRKLYHEGRLNDLQAQFFEPRPAEQLFDVEADPHETVNLADDPQYADKLKEMRLALAGRMKQLPDLSMYPENFLAEHAFNNPVAFGRAHQDNISELIDVANLSLIDFAEARPDLEKALQSSDANMRYWALIACSTHGADASRLVTRVTEMAQSDENRLVRVRAAEFLALIGVADPAPVITQALKETASGIEAGLILNSVTLLRDGKPGYDFQVSPDLFSAGVRKNDTVARRLEYLAP